MPNSQTYPCCDVLDKNCGATYDAYMKETADNMIHMCPLSISGLFQSSACPDLVTPSAGQIVSGISIALQSSLCVQCPCQRSLEFHAQNVHAARASSEGNLDCSSVLRHSDPCFACCLLSLSDIAHGIHYVLLADTNDINTVAFRSFVAPRQPYQNTCELALEQELEDLDACFYKHCVQLMFNRWSRLRDFWQRYKLGPLFSEIRAKGDIVLVTGCTVFVLREYGIEVSVVSLPQQVGIMHE